MESSEASRTVRLCQLMDVGMWERGLTDSFYGGGFGVEFWS